MTAPVTRPLPPEPLSSVSSLEVHFDLLDLTELTDMSDQELAEVFADSDDENLTGESPAGEAGTGTRWALGEVLGPETTKHCSPKSVFKNKLISIVFEYLPPQHHFIQHFCLLHIYVPPVPVPLLSSAFQTPPKAKGTDPLKEPFTKWLTS